MMRIIPRKMSNTGQYNGVRLCSRVPTAVEVANHLRKLKMRGFRFHQMQQRIRDQPAETTELLIRGKHHLLIKRDDDHVSKILVSRTITASGDSQHYRGERRGACSNPKPLKQQLLSAMP